MSEKLESQGELDVGEDEELLSDFKDLFPDEEPETEALAPVEPGDNSLDDLDAFLDDFEENVDISNAPDSVTVDESSEAEHLKSEPVELDSSALDLDVGLDGEVFNEELALDEEGLDTALPDESEAGVNAPEAPSGSGDELLDLDVMLDETEPSVTTEKRVEPEEPPVPEAVIPAPEIAPQVAQIPPPLSPVASALSKPQFISGVVLLSLSLLLSLAALWMGLGLGSQIDVLNQNVSELQQRVLAQSRRGSLSPEVAIGEQLNQLGERMNELAVIVEGPVSHLSESNQHALEALSIRLDRLEGRPLPAEGKAPAGTTTVLVKKVDVAPSSSTAKKTGWVINLLSVSLAKTANVELERLRKLGIRADKQMVRKEGKTWYRLRVTGFDSYEGAKAYVETVQKQTGFKAAWVAKD